MIKSYVCVCVHRYEKWKLMFKHPPLLFRVRKAFNPLMRYFFICGYCSQIVQLFFVEGVFLWNFRIKNILWYKSLHDKYFSLKKSINIINCFSYGVWLWKSNSKIIYWICLKPILWLYITSFITLNLIYLFFLKSKIQESLKVLKAFKTCNFKFNKQWISIVVYWNFFLPLSVIHPQCEIEKKKFKDPFIYCF